MQVVECIVDELVDRRRRRSERQKEKFIPSFRPSHWSYFWKSFLMRHFVYQLSQNLQAFSCSHITISSATWNWLISWFPSMQMSFLYFQQFFFLKKLILSKKDFREETLNGTTDFNTECWIWCTNGFLNIVPL